MLRRAGLGAVAAAVIALVGAAPASAWWAHGGEIDDGLGAVYVTGLPGETHDLTAIGVPGPEAALRLAPSPATAGSVVLRDATAPVTPPPIAGGDANCVKVDDHTVRCGAGVGVGGPLAVDYLDVDYTAGSGDDGITIPPAGAPVFLAVYAGPGDDSVQAYGPGGAQGKLGDGNDRLVLRGSLGAAIHGQQFVSGDAGDDALDVVNAHYDEPVCGDGDDTLVADPGEGSGDCESVRTVP